MYHVSYSVCVCVYVCIVHTHMYDSVCVLYMYNLIFRYVFIGSTHFSFQSDFANNEKFITIHVSNKTGGRKVYFPGE